VSRSCVSAANDVAADGIGFESEDNALAVFDAAGRTDIPRGAKSRVAAALLSLAAARLAGKA
jgi:phosphopantothenoylcysteine decarboxylase / phosphopantothenate---cysteine ligase